ncbi:HAMP domain-containing histidine kinase [Campylobacter volucris]|uniref:histidine kinase n=1 Tax=Campylobacter volucris TaxID=1031542 RepID=A0AAE5YGZ5_9BACT|nr:ArsS family sensor histidine kinase [Campylobacter volucris]AJC93898.1 two-component system sensor histidine kinase [Campylobacter volucris LMG 24379]KAB0580061.1 HAMP domain-containing histidine kinase [Campylobacter volucris]MBF7045638.1 HAMP domain-containing histidine kinase [Campylobacter volucris]MBF7068940.1 HAMP domain-containing histidine kinase [Campylobacter volucris]QBL13724.1 HAMP domain-containing histidine kinase [Campylobacter volucris]
MKVTINLKITILFAAAFLFVCALFVLLGKIQVDSYIANERAKQKEMVEKVVYNLEKSESFSLYNYLTSKSYSLVDNDRILKQIITKGEKVFRVNSSYGAFSSIIYHNQVFLYVEQEQKTYLYQLDASVKLEYLFLFSFIFILVLIVFLYFSVLRSLRPLKVLKNKIKNISAGKMEPLSEYFQVNDEISEISFEFDHAINKIQELVKSRQFFLRMIMHELKTPIGKGRIVCEMIDNQKQKDRLVDIFERLELLIDEFGKIEKVLSKNCQLNLQTYHLSLILEQAQDYLMRDDFYQKVKITYKEDAMIVADLELFSLLIKNLIDNAIKYSDDKSCEVICSSDYIMVRNKGSKFRKTFEYYLKPFAREENTQAEGMGLGLYIINNICNLHGFNICYSYEDGYHSFKILFSRIFN